MEVDEVCIGVIAMRCKCLQAAEVYMAAHSRHAMLGRECRMAVNDLQLCVRVCAACLARRDGWAGPPANDS